MKITLINCPSPALDEPAMNPPLGLCYIAAYLKADGYDNVGLVDYNLHEYDYYGSSEYLEEIPLNSNFYGISCMTPQYRWLREITAHIKKGNPSALVISGGPHSTSCPEDCLIDCGVDLAIRGEGEIPFSMLVRGHVPATIPGVAYLHRGEVVSLPWVINTNLDGLPFPDRSMTDLTAYKRVLLHQSERGGPASPRAVHLITLRGCPYNCAFCDKSGGRLVRYRSKENILEEVDFIREEYGVNAFVIYDDTFTLDRKRVYQICDAFKDRGSTWRTWARVNTVDREMLQRMKDSGCVKLLFGYESGDDQILKRISKQITREQIIESAKACKEVGIGCYASLIYGLPGETRESIDNTVSLIAETQPDELHFHALAPIPGSAIWDRPEVYGLRIDKKRLKEMQYDSVCLTNSASGLGNIYYEHDKMSREEFVENFRYYTEELQRVAAPGSIYQRVELDRIKEDQLV